MTTLVTPETTEVDLDTEVVPGAPVVVKPLDEVPERPVPVVRLPDEVRATLEVTALPEVDTCPGGIENEEEKDCDVPVDLVKCGSVCVPVAVVVEM